LFNIAVLAIGGSVLAWMLHRLGWQNVRHVLAGVGGWFFVIVAFDLGALACDAGAIHQFMRPEARMVAYWRVVCAQASGRAVNVLVPGGAVGEATKVSMLVAHVPRGRVVSSIVLFNLASFYLQVAVVVIGVPLTALLVDLPPDLKIVVWTGLGVLLPIVIALIVIIQRGALATMLASARMVHILSGERAKKLAARLLEVDRHIREVQSHPTAGTRIGLLLICASKLCSWSATTVVLYTVGVHLGFTVLVGVLSVGVLISWVSAFVPFGLGVADGSNYALFNVLGAAGAHGVFVTLLGRARNLTIALLGLLIMAAGHTANRIELARRNRLMARLEAEHGAESLARSG
jgi:hypothetical protein